MAVVCGLIDRFLFVRTFLPLVYRLRLIGLVSAWGVLGLIVLRLWFFAIDVSYRFFFLVLVHILSGFLVRAIFFFRFIF